MIADFFIGFFLLIINFIIGLLPNYSGMPSGVDTALTWIHNSLAGANRIFPMDTLIEIIGLVMAIEISILTFKGLNWVYNKVFHAG